MARQRKYPVELIDRGRAGGARGAPAPSACLNSRPSASRSRSRRPAARHGLLVATAAEYGLEILGPPGIRAWHPRPVERAPDV